MKKNIYQEMYGNGREIFLKSNPRIKIMKDIVNDLNLKSAKILDFACLDGTFLTMIDSGNNELFGLDASEYAVKECKKKGFKVIKFFFDSEKKLPYKDDYFDLVIMGEIIEHIYDTDYLLEEVKRILKPKGLLLTTTPNIASLGRRLKLLLGVNPLIELSPNEPDSSGHIRYFTFNTLNTLILKHGFEKFLSRSDVINFDSKGRIRTLLGAKIFPTLGASIINLSAKTK